MKLYDRYAALVTRHPRGALWLCLLSVLAFGYAARDVRLDNNFAALFSTSSEAADFRARYRQTFGADDGLLIAALRTERPEDPRFVALIERISRGVARSADVRRVYSPTETSVIFKQDDAARIEPAFGSASSFRGSFAERLQLIVGSPIGGDRIVSRDGRVFLVIAELDPRIDSYESIVEPAKRFRALVEREAKASGAGVEVHFAGVPYTRITAIDSMQGDLLLLAPLTSIALCLMLYAAFRRGLAVLAPMLCVGASIVATAGVIGLAGDDLNQVTVIYPVLLMVIAVATAIHQVHRFEEEYHACGDARRAACTAAARTTEASMLQTLTTVFGFGSLITSSMHILHTFGLYLAAGVSLAFIYIATIVPAMLALWGHQLRPRTRERARKSARYERYVRWLVGPRVSRTVTALSAVAFAVLAYASTDIVYDYRLSDNVPGKHPVARGNALIDSELAGIVPIELAFVGPTDTFQDPAQLARVERVAQYLKEREGLHAPISLAGVVREQNRVLTGQDRLPSDRETVAQLLLFADGSADRIVQQLATPDFAETRLRATMPDRGALYVGAFEQRVQQFAARVFAGTAVTVRLTGEAPVAYAGMNQLSSELLSSELWALLLVTLAIGVVFRSGKIAAASVLPNALPVLVALTFYALTGRAIDPLPGIVFCIGIGIAVDDTIHVIARYREELLAGWERREAMVRTMVSLSGALLSSSAAIGAGFLVLCLSDFNMNRTMGWLGALMMALAAVFELVCTPPALVMFHWRVGRASTARTSAKAAEHRGPQFESPITQESTSV